MAERVFNPLEKGHLAESVVGALLEGPCRPLPPKKPFGGAGVYVLYYHGSFSPYAALARANMEIDCSAPIYVGRARQAGARKGFDDDPDAAQQPLYGRLCEHAESIRSTSNLRLSDFRCRYLVVDELWVPLAELLLLARYRPVWNSILDGFGNHDPGAGRTNQKRSPWDVLHPGRPWAAKLAPGKRAVAELEAFVRRHLGSSK